MFCGSADGELLPPYVVYKSSQMWTTWCQGGPRNTKYNHSTSGWFEGNTFTAWVRDLLIPHLNKQPGTKILIADNLASHFTVCALKLLKENNVKLICLPPNSTHLTQPLDKAVFRAVKGKWRELLGRWKETNTGARSTCIEKQYFPHLLAKLWEAITPNVAANLKSGFESCGIVPCSREKIMRFVVKPLDVDRDSIHSSFIESLDRKKVEWAGVPKPRKRKKITIIPGQSVDNNPSFTTEDPIPSTSAQPTQTGRRKQVQHPQDLDSEEELDENELIQDSSEDETLDQVTARFEQEEKEEDDFERLLESRGRR